MNLIKGSSAKEYGDSGLLTQNVKREFRLRHFEISELNSRLAVGEEISTIFGLP
jgi:hypothetical protein